jgi:glycolate oxidase iron-sulfur subunit
MNLDVDPADLGTCVSCGLCLPHCPTFRVTGDEARSPRGRISAMRGLVSGALDLDAGVVESMESCIQCRGCETACPSGVPFGSMMAITRSAISRGPRRRRARLLAPAMRLLSVGWLVRAGSILAAVGQRLGVVPSRRLGLPRRLPLRRPALRPSGDDVWIAPGCVMDAWFRDVHVDLVSLVEATGRGVAVPQRSACCGALAEHAGLPEVAATQARQLMASFPGDTPILVDAAGCGAMMKEYGTLLGTADAHRFSARVHDAGQWLAEHLHELPPPVPEGRGGPVAIQDPCHLRHVQRAHLPVRAVVGAVAEVIELDDDGLCCGAGGAFAVARPELADRVRERKLAAIARSGAPTVASANPGCAIHLQWGGVEVRHPVSILAEGVGVGHGR